MPTSSDGREEAVAARRQPEHFWGRTRSATRPRIRRSESPVHSPVHDAASGAKPCAGHDSSHAVAARAKGGQASFGVYLVYHRQVVIQRCLPGTARSWCVCRVPASPTWPSCGPLDGGGRPWAVAACRRQLAKASPPRPGSTSPAASADCEDSSSAWSDGAWLAAPPRGSMGWQAAAASAMPPAPSGPPRKPGHADAGASGGNAQGPCATARAEPAAQRRCAKPALASPAAPRSRRSVRRVGSADRPRATAGAGARRGSGRRSFDGGSGEPPGCPSRGLPSMSAVLPCAHLGHARRGLAPARRPPPALKGRNRLPAAAARPSNGDVGRCRRLGRRPPALPCPPALPACPARLKAGLFRYPPRLSALLC